MSILIIGGSGFVGSRLISLMKNNSVINLDKRKSDKYNSITKLGDIRFIDQIFINNKIKTVVLLAAEHKDNVNPISLYYDVNVEGTKNVLKRMDSHGITNLIFTSSVAVYGLNTKFPNEQSNPKPFNHYGKK